MTDRFIATIKTFIKDEVHPQHKDEILHLVSDNMTLESLGLDSIDFFILINYLENEYHHQIIGDVEKGITLNDLNKIFEN